MLSKIDINAEVSPCIHAKDYSYIDLKLYLSLSAKIWVLSLPDLYLFKQRFAMHKKHWDLHVSSAFISSQSVTAVPKCLWNFVLGFLVLPSGLSSTAILLQKQEKHWRLGVFGVVLPPEYAWSNIIFTDLQRHCSNRLTFRNVKVGIFLSIQQENLNRNCMQSYFWTKCILYYWNATLCTMPNFQQ